MMSLLFPHCWPTNLPHNHKSTTVERPRILCSSVTYYYPVGIEHRRWRGRVCRDMRLLAPKSSRCRESGVQPTPLLTLLLGSFLSGSGGQGMLLLKRGSEYRKLQQSPLASIFFSSIPPTPMRSSSSFRCGNDIPTEKTCCQEKNRGNYVDYDGCCGT